MATKNIQLRSTGSPCMTCVIDDNGHLSLTSVYQHFALSLKDCEDVVINAGDADWNDRIQIMAASPAGKELIRRGSVYIKTEVTCPGCGATGGPTKELWAEAIGLCITECCVDRSGPPSAFLRDPMQNPAPGRRPQRRDCRVAGPR